VLRPSDAAEYQASRAQTARDQHIAIVFMPLSLRGQEGELFQCSAERLIRFVVSRSTAPRGISLPAGALSSELSVPHRDSAHFRRQGQPVIQGALS
jgi:hypothetical protein